MEMLEEVVMRLGDSLEAIIALCAVVAALVGALSLFAF